MHTPNYQDMEGYVCAFCDTYGLPKSNSTLVDYDNKGYNAHQGDISNVTRIPLPSPPRDESLIGRGGGGGGGCFKVQSCGGKDSTISSSMGTFTTNNKCMKHMPILSVASNICCSGSQIKHNPLDSYNILYTNQDMFSKSVTSQSEANPSTSAPLSDTFDYLHCLPTPTTLSSTSWAYPEYTYDKSPICSEFPIQQIMFPEYPGLISNYNDSNMMDCSTLANKDYGYMAYKVPAPNLYTSDLIHPYDNNPPVSSPGIHHNVAQPCTNGPPSLHIQSGMFGSTQYGSTLNSPMELPRLTDLPYDPSLHPQYKEHNTTDFCYNRMVNETNYSPDIHHNLNDQHNKCFKMPVDNIMLHSIKKTNDSLAVRRGKPISSLIKSYIPLSESILKCIVDDYLSLSPSEYQKQRYSITIYTGKVAQKSYGTEKRYLCPPPYVRLLGSKWFENCSDNTRNTDPIFSGTNQKDGSYGTNMFGMNSLMDIYVTSLLLDVEESFSISSMDCYCSDGSAFRPGCSKTTPIWGKTNLRAMYIPDRKEKIRSTCLKVQLHKKNKEFNFAQFQSSPICIISKASQKKTSSKNNDMLIYHGSMIALFNRSKAQTNRIRFLGSSSSNSVITNKVLSGTVNHELELNPENTFLTANSQAWEPFQIWSLDLFTNPMSFTNMDQSMSLIRFNQVVVLQCSTTGLITTPLIIRRVDGRNTVIKTQDISRNNDYKNTLDLNEPVNSLQKVAFQIYTEDPNLLSNIYLTYQDENIIMQPARIVEKDELDLGYSDLDSSSKMPKNSLWDTSNNSETLDTFFSQKNLLDNTYNRLFSFHDFMQKHTLHRTNNDMVQDSQQKSKPLYMKSVSQNSSVDKNGTTGSFENTSESVENVLENAIWNIVGISSVESSVYISPKSKVNTIGLVPVIKEVKYLSVDVIQIIGQNINQSYSVWIGGKPCKTFRFSTFFADDSSMFIDLQCVLHPQILPQDLNYILLVRDDGVIFDSKKHL